ncbi:MAG TPA: zeta toxin family protein [Kofleriaceae bacterium]
MSIYVLAGTNGAGKSSIGGAMIRAAGADYFNPDEAARQILEANPGATIAEANGAAWLEGKRLLERAIAEQGNFAFETTLGGATITRLLAGAMDAGIDVHVWYVALNSPDLHLARVRARVSRGGHDIPERDIRRRYDASRHNLIELLPRLASLRVYDNSTDADPAAAIAPKPVLLLHTEHGRIVYRCEPASAPDWAKPILLIALT